MHSMQSEDDLAAFEVLICDMAEYVNLNYKVS